MFVGRKKELAVLEETCKKPGFQMTVVYGRRRIGKSRLITEFLKGKKASYYVAGMTSIENNVKKWSFQVVADLAPNMKWSRGTESRDHFRCHFTAQNCYRAHKNNIL